MLDLVSSKGATLVAKGTKRKGNYPKAKYRYLNGDTKHPYEFKKCPVCKESSWIQTRRETCSYTCARTGDRNPSWNPDSVYKRKTPAEMVKYHKRVVSEYGKASDYRCIECIKNTAQDWANQTGNYEDIEDFDPMCRSCHRKFDWQRKQ